METCLTEISRESEHVMGKEMRLPAIYLLDRSLGMVEAWQDEFAGIHGVTPVLGEFSRFLDEHPEIDCVVSPGNAYGIMDGGYDRAITMRYGEGLMHKVQRAIIERWFGEQPIGTSISVSHGGITLIHTPTMRIPSEIDNPMVVYHAMRSTLIEAMSEGVRAMVIPAFGGGCGMLPFNVISSLMASAYHQIANPPKRLGWDYANSYQPEDYIDTRKDPGDTLYGL